MLTEIRKLPTTKRDFATAQLVWTDRKGGSNVRQGNAAILAKRLETLRCEASLYLVDEKGKRGEKIGGCEYQPFIADDSRIKWHWWYEKDMLEV